MKTHPCAVTPAMQTAARKARAKNVTLLAMSVKWDVSESALSRAINGVGAYGKHPYTPSPRPSSTNQAQNASVASDGGPGGEGKENG